ncbi:MAG: hypothetical protein HQK59_00560 [Deltaproteobacteria bacterium]|nr:hypothetical protein [Deltaproteobacteria bacterium]
MDSQLLTVLAGPRIINRIREEGLTPGAIKAVVGPATGPRWMAFAGLDVALLESGLLRGDGPVLLAGGSAGSWRMTAWCRSDPIKALAAFRAAYVDMMFKSTDTPEDRTNELVQAIDRFMPPEAETEVLSHPIFRLVVTTARVKSLLASESSTIRRLGYGLAGAVNLLWRGRTESLIERVTFCAPGAVTNGAEGLGRRVTLNPENLRQALLASGAVPLAVPGVTSIPGAPPGSYQDAGLAEYYLNARYITDPNGITLILNHGPRLVPVWLDKRLPGRRPMAEYLENVLLVCPGPAFMAAVPRGRAPDRTDYREFYHRPQERARLWNEIIDKSMEFGSLWHDLITTGRIREVVKPLI